MRLAQSGETRFASLYSKYYRRMVRYFVRAFRVEEADAEELAQDAFVRFFEAMDHYRGEAEWAFLETVALRVGLNRVRSRKTARHGVVPLQMDAIDPDEEPPSADEADVIERLDTARRRKRLHDAIAALPSSQRQCLQLWLEDFTPDEIAKALRLTRDAAKSRIRDAKRALQQQLGEDGVLPEDER